MTEKELSEIKKRIRYDKNNITKLYCCLVNTKKEITATFTQTVGLLPLEENEFLFKHMKKVLSGAPDRNLHDIVFSTEQVSGSEEHKLFMTLCESELENEAALRSLYEKIASSYQSDDSYLIILGCDKYDVPTKTKNDEFMDDASEQVFKYIICAVLPVKATRMGLGFSGGSNSFKMVGADMAVSAPELGFMFPTFDDRSTNIYNALYYTRVESENGKDVARTVFNTEMPMPAQEQKEGFRNLLAEAADDECSYDFIQSVHDHLSDMIEDHKNTNQAEPLLLGKKDVKRVLQDCGASESKISAFDEKYDTVLGEHTEIRPQAVINTKQFEVRTPDVTVKVKPDKSYMLDTRIIDGVKYIMIRAEEGVEVNGVSIHIDAVEQKDSAAE